MTTHRTLKRLTQKEITELAEREKGVPFDKLTKVALVVDLQKREIYYTFINFY